MLREPIDDLRLVESDPNNIQFIDNQTIDLQLLAINNKPSSIQHIKHPFIEVQRRAVELDPDSIQYFWKVADLDVRYLAIQTKPSVIQYIPNATRQEQSMAMKDFSYDELVDYVKNRDWVTEALYFIQNYKPMF
jgi:hypothetical protein